MAERFRRASLSCTNIQHQGISKKKSDYSDTCVTAITTQCVLTVHYVGIAVI